MLPSSDGPSDDRGRALRRWGPLGAIAVLLVIVVVAVVVTSGGGDDDGGGDGQAATSEGAPPEGAISWSMAQDEELDVTFPDTCDTDRGQVAIPYFQAAECYADVEGDNGGETSKGVTGDTIKVVAYLAQENDPVLDFITAAISNDDTTAQAKETYQGYADLFNAYYQTYGRKVELEFLDASGPSNDEVAARADAVKAAEEMGAFAVWGGPVLTSAFADELAARDVFCVGCTTGDPAYMDERAPYMNTTAMNADQIQLHLVEYMSKKLKDKPAAFAGDPAYQDQDRTFGFLWIESNDTSADQAATFEQRLGDEGIDLAESISYTLDPARLQEQATSVIARFKAAGVTSLVFSGDPVAPATFTQEATAQDWSPEWILGPSALVDTTAFSRTYDQEQWAHAFGPSALTARFRSQDQPPYALFEWFKGEAPPAVDTYAVLFPNPATFFAGVQAAGPNLTADSLQAGLFSLPPEEPAIAFSSQSWGDHGFWPYTDHNGTDDMTEIWWDPAATGPDEIRKEGSGMWRYVDGGKRYLPGTWTDQVTLFEDAGTVTILDGPPEGEAAPDYPAP